MSEITLESIEHLSLLSRIALTEEQKKQFAQDMQDIVSYVDLLQEVEVDGTPLCHNVLDTLLHTPQREDIVGETLERSDFLNSAPKQVAGLVEVPTIL